MKLAFLLPVFPSLSETFILNEMYWLQQSGVSGQIWYENHPATKIRQPVVKKLTYPRTRIIPQIIPPRLFSILFHQGWWLATHPLRYLKAISVLIPIINYENLRSFLKAGVLARQINRANCTLILAHYGNFTSLFAIFCKHLTGLPCGIVFHTEYLFGRPKNLKTKITQADLVVFKSNYAQDYASRSLKASPQLKAKMVVLPTSGVDTRFFSPKFRKQLTKTIRLVSVGRLEATKGFDKLISAIALLTQEGFAVRCSIVGQGSQYPKLKNQITRLGLEKNVSLEGAVGHTKQLLRLLNQAEIFVLPCIIGKSKDRDMLPNALKEAMAMKLLVITSNLGGIKELIAPDSNGFLLPSTQPAAIVQAIKKVFTLPKRKRHQIAQQARKTILQHYQAQDINQKLIKLLQRYSR